MPRERQSGSNSRPCGCSRGVNRRAQGEDAVIAASSPCILMYVALFAFQANPLHPCMRPFFDLEPSVLTSSLSEGFSCSTSPLV